MSPVRDVIDEYTAVDISARHTAISDVIVVVVMFGEAVRRGTRDVTGTVLTIPEWITV